MRIFKKAKVAYVNRRRLYGYGIAAGIVVAYLLVTVVPSGSLRGRADVTWLPFAEAVQAATPYARTADINDLIWSTLGLFAF